MLYTTHGQPMPSTPKDDPTAPEKSPQCSGIYSCLGCHAEIRANFDIDNPEYKKFWDEQI